MLVVLPAWYIQSMQTLDGNREPEPTQTTPNSGGASAVKEPGHFEVRKSPSQVTRMHFFPQKSWRPFSSCRPQNTGRQRHFTFKLKQIQRSDILTVLFSVHTNTESKQYAGLGRAEPGRWIFQPGHLRAVSPPLPPNLQTGRGHGGKMALSRGERAPLVVKSL